MEIFNKPNNLNGEELKSELANVGIDVDFIIDFADGTIGFDCTSKVKAEKVVSSHNGTIVAKEPSVSDKLSSVNLTIEDLKIALGLA